MKDLQLFLLFAFLTIMSANSTNIQERWDCPLENIDFNGQDIICFRQIGSWHDCGTLCSTSTRVGKCNVWTWEDTTAANEGLCCLKSSDSGLTVEPGFTSGQRGCM